MGHQKNKANHVSVRPNCCTSPLQNAFCESATASVISIPGSQLIQHTTCLQNPYWFYLPSNSVRDFSRKSMIQSCKFLKTGLSSDHNLTPPHAYHARTSTRIPSTQGTHGAKVPRLIEQPTCQTLSNCSHLFTSVHCLIVKLFTNCLN